MTIFGIGIDVIEVERIESAMGEFGDRFLERVFLGSSVELERASVRRCRPDGSP